MRSCAPFFSIYAVDLFLRIGCCGCVHADETEATLSCSSLGVSVDPAHLFHRFNGVGFHLLGHSFSASEAYLRIAAFA
jgi:hypothetical protein